MTAKAKSIRHVPGTVDTIKPGESLDAYEKRVGDDIPELGDDFFRNAKPISEFPDLARAIGSARKVLRGQRGPQKAPTKARVTLRLYQEIVDRYREEGPGWQTRINDDLVALNKRRRAKHG
jgi:uncharacterized protein (DUF4415 family)